MHEPLELANLNCEYLAQRCDELSKALSDAADAVDHAIYLVGPDANQIKGMVGAAERARKILKQ